MKEGTIKERKTLFLKFENNLVKSETEGFDPSTLDYVTLMNVWYHGRKKEFSLT